MPIRGITYTIGAVMLALSSCGAGQGPAQQASEETAALPDSVFIASYPFVNTGADTVYDPGGSLEPFFRKLRALDPVHPLAVKDTLSDGMKEVKRVNIIQFGDSHVQAGSMPEVVMRHFHTRFGNAGRGMIVPHRLSGSNEPRDYAVRIFGNQPWTTGRIVQPKCPLPIGLTGVAVESSISDNRLLLCALQPPENTHSYRFNKVRIFHEKRAPIFEAEERYSLGISMPELIYDFTTDLELVEPVDSLIINTYADGQFSKGPIYGFSLENGQPGVLYHALGVNSACYMHWGRHRTEVARQSVALDPDLIILSMGSNEAAGSNFNETVFYNEVDRFVSALREANPGVSVLLTSPAQAFRRGTPNVNFKYVSNTLRRYAEDKGVAFLDIYAATGGDGSAHAWASHHLMGRDKIHYTPEGYRIQGILIYNALYNGYVGYALHAN